MNKVLRFLILSWNYKISFFSYLLKCMCYLPFLKYEVHRTEDKIYDKMISKGHVEKGKIIEIKLFKFTFIKFTLQKGEALTAEHFYFQRSLKDIKYLLKNSVNYLDINKESVIFDPGCGTGKHLLYITDRYNCKGIGIDIYSKAINIPKKVEKFSNCKFLLGSSCDQDTLNSLSNNDFSRKIDIIYINSWVKHVYQNEEFGIFLDFIKKKNCKLMIIESKKIDLKSIFKTNKILLQKFKGKIQFVILEL